MNQFTVLSVFAALALGAVAYLETERGLFAPRAKPPAIETPTADAGSGSDADAELESMLAIGLDDDDDLAADDAYFDRPLDEMVERPLFNRSRRPVETVVASTGKATQREPDARQLLRYALIGTVIAGDRRVALLRSTQSPDVEQVRIGNELQGWRLEKLDKNAATFSRENRSVVLEIAPTF